MLISLEEAREYLRIDEDDTSNDDVILSSLETAQALCLDLARCEEADAEENPVVFHEAILYAAMPPPFCTSIGKKPIIPAY